MRGTGIAKEPGWSTSCTSCMNQSSTTCTEQNAVAYRLALFGMTLDGSNITLFEQPPLFVIDISEADQGGVTTTRKISTATMAILLFNKEGEVWKLIHMEG
ncbi:hypothetical protein RND71_021876 [Anisodus tanguticus]|uniref:Uncharacterized protein n=1 Tax=Anisodus tanguticus TaxID=243964 RepID=A0AAE1V8M4_9SOLA|nr:hypothetical protein RND71_021876 [Anisodus tanguticus]